MSEQKCTLKNLEETYLYLSMLNDGGFYIIEAFNIKGKVIGQSIFKINGKTCYLKRIEILDNNYAHVGLGSAMLKYIESFSIKLRCLNMDGKFYPFGELGEHSRAFYIKNGYEIYKDGYDSFIFKYLNREKDMGRE